MTTRRWRASSWSRPLAEDAGTPGPEQPSLLEGLPDLSSASAPATESPPSPAGPTTRVRLTVAYDGSGFHGFWPNEGVTTVGGTLQAAVERVIGHPIVMTCAGRTDTGVHAWGQVVTFDVHRAEGDLDLTALQHALNGLCGPAVAVRDPAAVPPDFDARSSATARVYRYTVLNRPVPDPFLAATSWQVARPLELPLLRLGCDGLIGEHDFTSFCRKPPPLASGEPRSLVRRVVDARWHDLGDGVLRFDIEASAFCHQMVRSIVGTLVAMGEGRLRPGEMLGIIAAQDRQRVPQLAPPQGLCLWEVRYPSSA